MTKTSNAFLTAALVATLSAMVACAPAKKGAKFKDHGAGGSNLPSADRFFKKQSSNEESAKFEKSVVMINARIEEATNSQIARNKLEAMAVERSEGKISGLPEDETVERGTKVDKKNVTGSKEPTNDRNKYLISIRITLEGIGSLDYINFNSLYGSERELIELLPANAECASKVAEFIEVRAACVDRLCNQLAVQVADVRSEPELLVNKILDQAAPAKGFLIKVTNYKMFNALADEATAVDELIEDTETEVETEATVVAKPIKPASACKMLEDKEKANKAKKDTAEENKAVVEEKKTEKPEAAEEDPITKLAE